MSDTKYVQHKSGIGEKWEIMCQNICQYGAKHEMKDAIGAHWLPKSEYVPCEPPERWEDVTSEYEAGQHCGVQTLHIPGHRGIGLLQGDRLRKIAVSNNLKQAFIIERKVQG